MKIDDILITDIDEFTTMTKNALRVIGIIYGSDLALLSKMDLAFIHLIGKKGKNNIVEFCKKHHIEFNRNSFLRK